MVKLGWSSLLLAGPILIYLLAFYYLGNDGAAWPFIGILTLIITALAALLAKAFLWERYGYWIAWAIPVGFLLAYFFATAVTQIFIFSLLVLLVVVFLCIIPRRNAA